MEKPTVVIWFKFYCALMALIYVAAIFISLSLAFGGFKGLVIGVILAALSAVFVVVSALPIVLPVKPWVWVYGVVLIALGMTSACLLPVCIPLLIFWIKPEVKRYYGKVVV